MNGQISGVWVTIAVVSVSVVVAVVVASVTFATVAGVITSVTVTVVFVCIPLSAVGRRRRRVFPDGRRRDFAPLVVCLSTFWPGRMTCRLVISRGGCFRVNSRYCFCFLLMELISFEETSTSPPR